MSKEITFSIMGSTFFPGASDAINRLMPGQPLLLRREPGNKYDKNAVAVIGQVRRQVSRDADQIKLGYVPRGVAAEIAPLMDAGYKVIARKAANRLYGVSELAFNPPPDAKEIPDELKA
jgi:HIRAN domain